MKRICRRVVISVFVAVSIFSAQSYAQVNLLADGTLSRSVAGADKDLSGLHYKLEDGTAANFLGGTGSGLSFVCGKKFVSLPDRGPNVSTYDPFVDNTTSYISRFHTLEMHLNRTPHGKLPFELKPELVNTTLLWSSSKLNYGTGALGTGTLDSVNYTLGSGVPPINNFFFHFFTGRSDNFNPSTNSGDPLDARFDTESIRVSNDGWFVFISDEYGPYVYMFNRFTGQRVRSFSVPAELYVTVKKAFEKDLDNGSKGETNSNTGGRTPNKGMEGLALTPDGKTLVGMLQAATIQDAKPAKKLLRMVSIDVETGTTHEYAYLLTDGSGVSDIAALNNHQFLVDERDGAGLGGDPSPAGGPIKRIFLIDLDGAKDITGLDGKTAAAAPYPVAKTLFLDVTAQLLANGYTGDQVPSKLEGITLGPDVELNGKKLHTLWLSNDNDFSPSTAGPNKFFAFGFGDNAAELHGAQVVVQHVRSEWECGDDDHDHGRGRDDD